LSCYQKKKLLIVEANRASDQNVKMGNATRWLCPCCRRRQPRDKATQHYREQAAQSYRAEVLRLRLDIGYDATFGVYLRQFLSDSVSEQSSVNGAKAKAKQRRKEQARRRKALKSNPIALDWIYPSAKAYPADVERTCAKGCIYQSNCLERWCRLPNCAILFDDILPVLSDLWRTLYGNAYHSLAALVACYVQDGQDGMYMVTYNLLHAFPPQESPLPPMHCRVAQRLYRRKV
jgi:hypothetical protein